MKFPKNTPVEQIRKAKCGDSFVHDGHQSSCTSGFLREQIMFETHRGWLVTSPSTKPHAITVVTVIGKETK